MTEDSAKGEARLFVLDTNVILHDAACIRNFEEHDIAIPITILEELDKFEKGNEEPPTTRPLHLQTSNRGSASRLSAPVAR